MITIKCLYCKKEFLVQPCRQNSAKYCSSNCFGKINSFQNGFQKGNQLAKGQIPWNKGMIGFQKGHIVTKETRRKIGEAQLGEKNHTWKGKEKKDPRGYLFIWRPNHLKAHYGRVQNSILVTEKCLGRLLTKEEVVHHIGVNYPMDSVENRGDDSPENLYLFPSRFEHTQYHFKKNKIQLTSNII